MIKSFFSTNSFKFHKIISLLHSSYIPHPEYINTNKLNIILLRHRTCYEKKNTILFLKNWLFILRRKSELYSIFYIEKKYEKIHTQKLIYYKNAPPQSKEAGIRTLVALDDQGGESNISKVKFFYISLWEKPFIFLIWLLSFSRFLSLISQPLSVSIQTFMTFSLQLRFEIL